MLVPAAGQVPRKAGLSARIPPYCRPPRFLFYPRARCFLEMKLFDFLFSSKGEGVWGKAFLAEFAFETTLGKVFYGKPPFLWTALTPHPKV